VSKERRRPSDEHDWGHDAHGADAQTLKRLADFPSIERHRLPCARKRFSKHGLALPKHVHDRGPERDRDDQEHQRPRQVVAFGDVALLARFGAAFGSGVFRLVAEVFRHELAIHLR
jgi:hypothetical protein